MYVTKTLAVKVTDCSPPELTISSIDYFDTNYVPRGISAPVSYSVFILPAVIPASVSIGSTGIIGKLTSYASSTKATVTGSMEWSFVVESDPTSSSTAIVNMIWKSSNVAGALTYAQQDRYRIDASGGLTPVRFEAQYTSVPTDRIFVFTF